MPEIALISVLLPAPLSPTTAVTRPGGMSRLMWLSTRTGPKLLPISTRRSSGSAPAPLLADGAVLACGAGSCGWSGVSMASVPSVASVTWGSGEDARPASAGRAPSALGVVTGRASLPSRSLRDPGGLAGGCELADAQLRGLHEVVRDARRLHVGRGAPRRRAQPRRPRDFLLGVHDRAVHQAARRGLARAQVHGQRDGRLGLDVDRLVDGAALVAGQDVLQPDQGRVLPGDREGLGLDAHPLQVGDDRGGVLIVRREHGVDVLVGRERLLEFGLRDRRGPGPGGLADLHVLAA